MDHGRADLPPGRLGQDGRDDIGEEEQAEGQEDPLGQLVVALDHEEPDGGGGQGDGDVLAHPEDHQAAGDAGELRGRVPDVGDQQEQEDVKRRPHAEILPDQVGQPLAGDHPHPGVHLLDDHQHQESRQEGPQQVVAILGPRHRVGGDAAGVVVHAPGDDAGAQHRHEDQEVAHERFPSEPAEEFHR